MTAAFLKWASASSKEFKFQSQLRHKWNSRNEYKMHCIKLQISNFLALSQIILKKV